MKKIFLILFGILFFTHLSAQDYTQVYLIGGAAPNEWDNGKAESLTQVSVDEESAIFTWTGFLKAGDFKFINKLQTWQPSFNASSSDEAVVLGQTHALVYNEDGNDYKFVLEKAGVYTVTIDIKKLTMTVIEAKDAQIPEELWIIGSAIPGNKAKLSNIPGIGNFLYAGELLQGDFKIITTETIDETTQYVIPYEEDVDITGETQFILTKDADLSGWNVMVSDPIYKIKINILRKKANAEIYKSRDMLYIVGGATESGWVASAAKPFTKDEVNPDIFTFDGELKIRPENEESNLFKILGQLDWNPYSLHPYESGEPILESEYLQISTGDNKWSIKEDQQGRYIIKVNTLYETIEAKYIENGSGIENNGEDELFDIKPVLKGIQVIMNGNYSADFAQLISMDGRIINSTSNTGKEFILQSNSIGTYLLKISVGKKHYVQRVIIK